MKLLTSATCATLFFCGSALAHVGHGMPAGHMHGAETAMLVIGLSVLAAISFALRFKKS